MVQDNRPAVLKGTACDRTIERHEHFFVDQSFSLWEIERQHAHLIFVLFVQSEARVFMVNDAAEGGGNRVEQGAQVKLRNHGVIDFEQHAQPVALLRQLTLVRLRALQIKRVVHCHGHLPRHLLHECDFALGIAVCRAAPEAHDAQTPLRRRQWNRAGRPHAVLAQDLQKGWVSRFLFCVVQDEWLLRFPHPSGRCLADSKFSPGTNLAGSFGFEDVQTHDVPRCVMQSQIQVIKFNHAMQPCRQFMKQFPQVAMLRDRFRNLEKRPVLRLRRSSRQ